MKTKLSSISGAALAVTAASLLSGCATSNSTNSSVVDLVHCSGVNQCNGHNDCKTAKNACAGHGSCKGHGFVLMPAKACSDVGGSITSGSVKSINTAELIHCSGVNVCKGHNDCKTANNDCAGHATCKGQGFVSTTKKSCADIGSKIS